MAVLRHRSTLSAPANFAGIVTANKYYLPEAILALKSIAVSGGYVVKCSGDGSGVVDTAGDVFNSVTLDKANAAVDIYGEPSQNNTPATARSLYNARPHFTLQRPGGLAGELSIQIVTNVLPGSVRVKYSAGGFSAATATAANQPSPTTGGDEVILLGGGTNAAPVGWALPFGGPYTSRSRLIIGVDGDTTAPYLYMKHWQANDPVASFCLMWDAMLGNRVGITPNNSVAYAGQQFLLTTMADEDKITTPLEGYTFAGRAGSTGTNRMVPTVPGYNNTGYGIVPLVGVLSHDLVGGRVRGIPGDYVRRNVLAAPDGGIYGRSNAWRWNVDGWDTGRMGVDRDGVSWLALDDILVRINLDDVTGTGNVKMYR